MSIAFDAETGAWRGRPAHAAQQPLGTLLTDLRRSMAGAGDDARFLCDIESRLVEDAQNTEQVTDTLTWLGDIYSLVARQQPDEAADVLFDHVDDLLLEQQFQSCDDLLRTIDLKRLDRNLLIALLSITLSAKEALPYRPRLLERTRARLTSSDPGRVDRLLDGLD